MRRYGMVFLLLGLALTASCSSSGDGIDVHLSPKQIANRAKPAVVEVTARFQVAGTVPRMGLDNEKMAHDLLEAGVSGNDKHKFVVTFWSLLLDNPSAYLKKGNDDELQFKNEITSLGSGFIVTPDGYVLTNAHVVKPSEEDIQKALMDSILQLVVEDGKRIVSSFNDQIGGDIDENHLKKLVEALAMFYAKGLSVETTPEYEVWTASGSESGHHCELVKVGEVTPGKDIAVLKMEGAGFPTLPLEPRGQEPQVGEPLYVDGYPGEVAIQANFTPQSRMQPSQTSGTVSSVRTTVHGWKEIQTDATMNHGNSGGPVLNDMGQVVGLATYQAQNTQGVNFALSINLAREFLDTLNVKPTQSEFTRKYNHALVEYERINHGNALDEFKALETSYPDVGTVKDFVQQLNTNRTSDAELKDDGSSTGSQGHPPSHPPILLFAIIAIVLVAVLITAATARS